MYCLSHQGNNEYQGGKHLWKNGRFALCFQAKIDMFSVYGVNVPGGLQNEAAAAVDIVL